LGFCDLLVFFVVLGDTWGETRAFTFTFLVRFSMGGFFRLWVRSWVFAICLFFLLFLVILGVGCGLGFL